MSEKGRWWWLASRIDDLNLTRAEFASKIGLAPARITEMIRNTPVNGGKTRNFPQEKLPDIARVLGINFISLVLYNIGQIDTVSFLDGGNSNIYDKYNINSPSVVPSQTKLELLDMIEDLDDGKCNQILGFIKAQNWIEKNTSDDQRIAA